MKQIKKLALVAGLMTMASFAQADTIGTSAGQVLKMGASAKGAAMAESISTLPQDSDAIYWNPAGLARVEGNSATFAHTDYLQRFFYDFASYSRSIKSYGTVGVSFQYLSSPKVDETDATGNTVGNFRFTDQVIAVGYGKDVTLDAHNSLAVGASAKLVRSKIIETAQTGALDLGMLWTHDATTLGLALQNMGGKLNYNREGSHLPLNFKLGLSHQWTLPLVTAIDVNFPRDNDPNIAFGSEYGIKIVDGVHSFLRAGYSTANSSDISGLTSMSLGSGLDWKAYRVDFAWVPFGRLGQTYRFGLTAKWGK